MLTSGVPGRSPAVGRSPNPLKVAFGVGPKLSSARWAGGKSAGFAKFVAPGGAAASAAPSAAPATQPYNYHDSAYENQVGGVNYSAQLGRVGIQHQLDALAPENRLALDAQDRWYQNDTAASNAALAARGAFSSGSRDQAFADREAQDKQQRASIDDASGATARLRLTDQLAGVESQQRLGVADAESSALGRYVASPAVPDYGLSAAAPAAAAPVAAVAPKVAALVKGAPAVKPVVPKVANPLKAAFGVPVGAKVSSGAAWVAAAAKGKGKK